MRAGITGLTFHDIRGRREDNGDFQMKVIGSVFSGAGMDRSISISKSYPVSERHAIPLYRIWDMRRAVNFNMMPSIDNTCSIAAISVPRRAH